MVKTLTQKKRREIKLGIRELLHYKDGVIKYVGVYETSVYVEMAYIMYEDINLIVEYLKPYKFIPLIIMGNSASNLHITFHRSK